jgi:hypothetical protein
MDTKLKSRINFLTGYAIVSSLVFALILFSSFDGKERNVNYDEITTKRINLVGEDGSLRMVISNENRQHSGRMNGKDLEKRERPAGIIFFNTEGDECGGLIYKSKTENGVTKSGMSFTMDQYKEDQVIQLLNDESFKDGKSNIQRGLSINEYPNGSTLEARTNKLKELEKIENETERKKKIREFYNKEGVKQRVFIGRTAGNSSGLFLAGTDGKLKMMIYVDDKGNPKIETFDSTGGTKNHLLDK